MNVVDQIALLLVPLAVANVGSTVILVLAARRHHWPALQERATVAVVLAVVAIAAALVGLVRLRLLDLDPEVSLGVIAIGLALISVPSILWLIAFLAGRFKESDAVTAARAEDAAEGPYDGRGDH